eukprot:767404-Hanusia_phi.AAC.4
MSVRLNRPRVLSEQAEEVARPDGHGGEGVEDVGERLRVAHGSSLLARQLVCDLIEEIAGEALGGARAAGQRVEHHRYRLCACLLLHPLSQVPSSRTARSSEELDFALRQVFFHSVEGEGKRLERQLLRVSAHHVDEMPAHVPEAVGGGVGSSDPVEHIGSVLARERRGADVFVHEEGHDVPQEVVGAAVPVEAREADAVVLPGQDVGLHVNRESLHAHRALEAADGSLFLERDFSSRRLL